MLAHFAKRGRGNARSLCLNSARGVICEFMGFARTRPCDANVFGRPGHVLYK